MFSANISLTLYSMFQYQNRCSNPNSTARRLSNNLEQNQLIQNVNQRANSTFLKVLYYVTVLVPSTGLQSFENCIYIYIDYIDLQIELWIYDLASVLVMYKTENIRKINCYFYIYLGLGDYDYITKQMYLSLIGKSIGLDDAFVELNRGLGVARLIFVPEVHIIQAEPL